VLVLEDEEASMDSPPDDQRDDLGVLGVLTEPNRRALYDFVVAQHDWVSRDRASDAVGLGRGVTAHHLDRLAANGLLEVDYRRCNDRRGPGAGRPAKVYRRAPAEIAVSVPPRDYELAGHLLAEAAERSKHDASPITHSIDGVARRHGRTIGLEARSGLDGRASRESRRLRFLEALDLLGFEPAETTEGGVVLRNCPFHHLAQLHTELICEMNLSLLDSALDEFGGTGWCARLQPLDGQCCVRLQTRARA
jgi:predicted ArsR family transcriptional regulator